MPGTKTNRIPSGWFTCSICECLRRLEDQTGGKQCKYCANQQSYNSKPIPESWKNEERTWESISLGCAVGTRVSIYISGELRFQSTKLPDHKENLPKNYPIW